jgi:hypothetical protein
MRQGGSASAPGWRRGVAEPWRRCFSHIDAFGPFEWKIARNMANSKDGTALTYAAPCHRGTRRAALGARTSVPKADQHEEQVDQQLRHERVREYHLPQNSTTVSRRCRGGSTRSWMRLQLVLFFPSCQKFLIELFCNRAAPARLTSPVKCTASASQLAAGSALVLPLMPS